MELLDRLTQINIDALWKEYVIESQKQSRMKTLVYPVINDFENEELKIELMEEGNWPPSPEELPMPPQSWLV